MIIVFTVKRWENHSTLNTAMTFKKQKQTGKKVVLFKVDEAFNQGSEDRFFVSKYILNNIYINLFLNVTHEWPNNDYLR